MKWNYGNDGDQKWRVVKLPAAPPPPTDEPNATFDCGCAWNDERYVMLNPDVGNGSTVVARPPNPGCAACTGSGKITDKHHYLKKRRNYDDEVVALYFPGGGYQVKTSAGVRKEREPTGRIGAGRPRKTIQTLGATVVYVMDVAEEVLAEYETALSHFTGEREQAALEMVCKIILARAPAANPRVMAQSGHKSAKTYYRWRNEGQVFLDQLDRIESQLTRIENKLDHKSATEDIRAIQLFRAVGELDDDLELDSEA